MNAPVTGAVGVFACDVCRQPVTRCTAPACAFFGFVHLRSRLHRCEVERPVEVHARVRRMAA